MSFVASAVAITSRFATQWAASAYTAVTFQVDNEAFTPPNPDPDNVTATSWVRQTITPTATDGLTFTKDRSYGLAVYSIFTPLDAGLGDALAMADVIRGFFNRTEAASVVYIGPSGEGPAVDIVGPGRMGFHQVDVNVPWQYFD